MDYKTLVQFVIENKQNHKIPSICIKHLQPWQQKQIAYCFTGIYCVYCRKGPFNSIEDFYYHETTDKHKYHSPDYIMHFVTGEWIENL